MKREASENWVLEPPQKLLIEQLQLQLLMTSCTGQALHGIVQSPRTGFIF